MTPRRKVEMKALIARACVVLVAGATVWGQSKEPGPSVQKASVVIGTAELSLGMPKDAVLARLSTDFKLINLHDDPSLGSESYMIGTGGSPVIVIGEVQFRDKKLQSVSRNWEPENKNDTIPFLKSLFAATASMHKEEDTKGLGFVTCLVHPESTQTPDVELQKIDFYCGPKLLSLQIITANGRKFGNDVHLVETLRADH